MESAQSIINSGSLAELGIVSAEHLPSEPPSTQTLDMCNTTPNDLSRYSPHRDFGSCTSSASKICLNCWRNTQNGSDGATEADTSFNSESIRGVSLKDHLAETKDMVETGLLMRSRIHRDRFQLSVSLEAALSGLCAPLSFLPQRSQFRDECQFLIELEADSKSLSLFREDTMSALTREYSWTTIAVKQALATGLRRQMDQTHRLQDLCKYIDGESQQHARSLVMSALRS